jgi:hypothetical protein
MYRPVGFSNSRVNFPSEVAHPIVRDSRLFNMGLRLKPLPLSLRDLSSRRKSHNFTNH